MSIVADVVTEKSASDPTDFGAGPGGRNGGPDGASYETRKPLMLQGSTQDS